MPSFATLTTWPAIGEQRTKRRALLLAHHDAIPLEADLEPARPLGLDHHVLQRLILDHRREDRKSTRLNSSHLVISYAVFCLKKKRLKPEIKRELNHIRKCKKEH